MDTVERYVGKLLDHRYQIRRVIGIGGMAVVFEATDVVMNRLVAVKMLKEEMANDEQAVRRFINESKAVSMLSHPNIVKIFDVSVKGKLKYIVMERIEGITLKSYMQKKGALSTDEVISYSEQVLKALEHAHSKGIIHRDIKPQNILLLKNGRVKVTDFGIAMLTSEEPYTHEKKAIGTVYYISPEQASGKEVDSRSDLYSLGVLMYEMATGTLPFNADTPVSVAMMQVKEQPTPPTERKADIPMGLEQIILGAMEKRPERRFQSAEQILRYIDRLRTNPDYIFKIRKPDPASENDHPLAMDTSVKKKKSKKSSRKRPESRSMFPIILGVCLAFLIVLTVGGVTLIDMVLKDQNENTPETITVVNGVGQIYTEDTIGEIFDPSIYKIVLEKIYTEEYPLGTIVSQEPEEGAKRKVLKNTQYCTVTLTVSMGAETLAVPDYTMLDYRAVQLEAEKLGFRCELVPLGSDYIDIGMVIRTEPSRYEVVNYGSTLTIYYSTGSSPSRLAVPVLTGLTPKQAYARMNGNFKVGTVTREYSDTVAEGLILSQSIPSGETVVKGTTIHFVISKGPAPSTEQTLPLPEDTDLSTP